MTTCGQKNGGINETQRVHIPYDLSKPSKKFKLPKKLIEVSGLSYYRPGQLLMIQDEDAKLYVYDYHLEELVDEIKFGKKGDYEGVEWDGEHVYVTNSSGQLFKFEMNQGGEAKAAKISTPLGKINDVEGLGFDPIDNALLVACKGDAEIVDKLKGKAVYSFYRDLNELSKAPRLLVRKKEVTAFIELHKEDYEKKESPDFKPSGIAVHPITGRFYLLASAGKSLIVLNRDGTIYDYHALNSEILKQPEGICFSPQGALFISTEGVDKKAKLYRFDML